MTPEKSISSSICICGNPECVIPHGCCHCGCGKTTSLWTQNHTRSGGIKGTPRKYFGKHSSKRKLAIEQAMRFKIDGVYCRFIPLTRGLYTIVWESDYEWLMQWKWCASYARNTDSYYVHHKDNKRSDGHTVSMHRFILGLQSGDERTGDHINGNSLDNRRTNLRIVNEVQSSQNRGMRTDNTTGFKGVYPYKDTGKYAAQIRANRQTFFLGVCDTPEEASQLYCAAAEKYHGRFQRI